MCGESLEMDKEKEVELKEETVSNLDYLYNVLNKEKELREKKKANDVYRPSRLPKKVFDETAITAGLRWQLEWCFQYCKNHFVPHDFEKVINIYILT